MCWWVLLKIIHMFRSRVIRQNWDDKVATVRLWYRPRTPEGCGPDPSAFICDKQNTACALRFLNKIIVHFIIPKNAMNRNFQKSALTTATSKFQVLPAAAHWFIMSTAPNLSEDASEAAGDLSKSHSPLVLILRNPLLPWLPVSLRHMLQRVKRGVSPSWPVRHNLLVRPLKTFSSLVKSYRRRNSLFTALGCFCWKWLLLQCLRRQPLPHPAPRQAGTMKTVQQRNVRPGIWWCCTAAALLKPLTSGLLVMCDNKALYG